MTLFHLSFEVVDLIAAETPHSCVDLSLKVPVLLPET